MFELENGRQHFYQWDTGQRLIISDNTVIEAHFCNRTDDCSLICEAYTDGGKRVVDVPNILLQDYWDIRVYAYCGNYTKVEQRYEVVKRSKPADYVYTETEVKSWNAMEDRVENTLSSIERLGVQLNSAENMRQDAEDERVMAESERATAEEAREKAYKDAMNAWNTSVYGAVNNAKTATANANKAAENANNAVNTLLANAHAAAIIPEIDAAMVSVDDAAAGYAVGAISYIKAEQLGTGEASAANVRPIKGRDAVKVSRTEVNLFANNTDEIQEITYNTSTGGQSVVKGYLVELPVGEYKVKAEYIDANNVVYIYGFVADGDMKPVQTKINPVVKNVCEEFSFTIKEGYKLLLYNGSTTHSIGTTKAQFKKVNISIYRDDEPTNVEAYNGNTYTTNLPETVYGGTFDWNTGVLTITHGKIELDGESADKMATKSSNTSYNTFLVTTNSWGRLAKADAELLVSHYVYNGTAPGSTHVKKQGVMICSMPGSLYIGDSGFTDAAAYNAWLKAQYAAGTPVSIVYELETPITHQLTAQQIEMLKGKNNVWSDTGDTNCAYIADTKIYIDNKINELTNAIISLGSNV